MTSPDWNHREKVFRVLLFLDRPLTAPEKQTIVDLFDGAQLVNLSSVDQDLAEHLMIMPIPTCPAQGVKNKSHQQVGGRCSDQPPVNSSL